MEIIDYQTSPDGIDWQALKADLHADHFDNGRSQEQLRRSFENSAACVFARTPDGRVIGKARGLSDGVCNAYVVDVWTHSAYRRRGIASEMMRRLLAHFPGQHVYLFTDDAEPFYRQLGFQEQGVGMSLVVGRWLESGE